MLRVIRVPNTCSCLFIEDKNETSIGVSERTVIRTRFYRLLRGQQPQKADPKSEVTNRLSAGDPTLLPFQIMSDM